MPVVHKTVSARRDLREIFDYLDREASEETARRMLRRIQQVAESLARMPYSAQSRPELGGDIRSRPTGPYVVYYRPIEEGIQVVRVLHGSRDVGPEMMT